MDTEEPDDFEDLDFSPLAVAWLFFRRCCGAISRAEPSRKLVKLAWKIDDFCYARPWMCEFFSFDEVRTLDKWIGRYCQAEGRLWRTLEGAWKGWKQNAECEGLSC